MTRAGMLTVVLTFAMAGAAAAPATRSVRARRTSPATIVDMNRWLLANTFGDASAGSR